MLNRLLTPEVVDTLLQGAGETALAWVRARALRPAGSQQAPYPRLARHVCLAHCYLLRSIDRPEQFRLQQLLARSELEEAAGLALSLRPLAKYADACKKIERAAHSLTGSLPVADTRHVAAQLWELADQLLDAAE